MKNIRLAVVGSRNFTDKSRLFMELNELRKFYKITLIVSGGAKGADTFAENYAKEYGIKKLVLEADWTDMSEPCRRKLNSSGKEYNALAGFKRNSEIVENCDALVAFWDGTSPGTRDIIDKAKLTGKKVKIYNLSL